MTAETLNLCSRVELPDSPPRSRAAGATRGAATKPTVRRHSEPYAIIEKIKLWPSKTGLLHGVRSIRLRGGMMEIHTHCGQTARVRNSRTGRVARHLRNKQFAQPCPRCRIPAWKIEKFEDTAFV